MTVPRCTWISCGSPVLFQKGRRHTLQCDVSSDAPETAGRVLVPLLRDPMASEALGRMFPAGHADPQASFRHKMPVQAAAATTTGLWLLNSETILNPSAPVGGTDHGYEHYVRPEMVCGPLLDTGSLELPTCHQCSESGHRDPLLWLLLKHSRSCLTSHGRSSHLLPIFLGASCGPRPSFSRCLRKNSWLSSHRVHPAVTGKPTRTCKAQS